MKSKLILLFFPIFFFIQGCKKENLTNENKNELPNPLPSYINIAKDFLKKQLSPSDLKKLDWDKIIIYKNKDSVEIVAVPYMDKSITESAYIFLNKKPITGNWVNIGKYGNNKLNKITTTSFDRSSVQVTNIDTSGFITTIINYKNGLVVSNSSSNRSSAMIYRVPVQIDGPNHSLLILAESLGIGVPDFSVPGNGYEYLMTDPNADGIGGGGSFVEIEFESLNNDPAIDLAKYFKCFNDMPDAGASFSVKLCTDIPVNSDPLFPVDFSLSPGHTFLTLIKTNGAQNITQSFGFYPDSRWNIAGFSVTSKIKDNGVQYNEHEYNASIVMNNISAAQFNQILSASQTAAQSNYNLQYNNCTNYALGIINSIKTDPIIPLPYDTQWSGIPFLSVTIPASPQGLYLSLAAKKSAGGSESQNIFVGIAKASTSHVPCN